MDQNPPPPPPPSSGPQAGYGPGADPRARPGIVTTAAVFLFVSAGFLLLGALILLIAKGDCPWGASCAFGSAVGGVLVIATLIGVFAAAEVYAGMQVLDLKESGRILGIVLAAIGLVFELIMIGRATQTSITWIAIDAFIVGALVTNRQFFTR